MAVIKTVVLEVQLEGIWKKKKRADTAQTMSNSDSLRLKTQLHKSVVTWFDSWQVLGSQ